MEHCRNTDQDRGHGWAARALATATLWLGMAAGLPAQAQVSAEDMARMRELQPGEFVVKTREGCGTIRKERGPNSREIITTAASRDSWEGACSEGMALGPGTYVARNDKMETVGSTDMWFFYGRGIGHAVYTGQTPGIYLGSKSESFSWDGISYSRNVARMEALEPRENAVVPRIWYSPREYANELAYTLHPACGVDRQPCVTEQRPSPTGNFFDGLKHLPCNGSCGSLWMEKAGPLFVAFDDFARQHAADVESVKKALEPTLARLGREAAVAQAEKERQAERQRQEAQAQQQRQRDEAARAEQQFRTSLQTMNPGQLFARADELTAQGDAVRAREVQRALVSRFPDHPLAATAARQMTGGAPGGGSTPAAPAAASAGGSATPAGTGAAAGRLPSAQCEAMKRVVMGTRIPSNASVTASTETVMFMTGTVLDMIAGGCPTDGTTPAQIEAERKERQQQYKAAEDACNAVQSGGRRCVAANHFGPGAAPGAGLRSPDPVFPTITVPKVTPQR
ncbi:hypothetical protein PGB34_05070 [Xenophilus arseniciresistens]|uniref:Uncharacterized protein n=1 Tax=Xenophilus arseniciresistens TaxID=1283306 RepID=A0AAE3N6E6_9BURK|nr:hypothetical protein [Xenophilus arseniciresistens]MDA7415728.1 hypothetical protein [Xenophilus arseniciresistens]